MRGSRLLIAGIIAAPLIATQSRAEILHMQPDMVKSDIRATVTEPLGLLRDHPNATGRFELITGEIAGDPDDVGRTGHVKLVINATTYSSGSDARDRAVIGTALETGKYQTIIFESTRFEDVQVEVPGVSGTAVVVGYLTLHGTRRLMKIPVRVSMSTDGGFSAGGEVTFKYTDFGVKRPWLLFVLPVSDEVTVSFRILAQRPGSEPSAEQNIQLPPGTQHEPMRLASHRVIR
jgi:polyisoprenoid-binding protein YceI